MSVLLALGSALTFGVADFLGGIASRRAATWSVVIGSQFCGLALLVGALPLLPTATYGTADLAWGAAGGVAGAIGLTQFFRALSLGNMSVCAPIAAVITGAVPVVAGVGMGERPEPLAWVGIVLAFPAIALISRELTGADTRTPPTAIGSAVIAGFGFGAFLVFLDRTGEGAGIQPLIAARVASVVLLTVLGLAIGKLAPVGGRLLGVVAASGVLDMAANVMFLYAVREGLLALGAVISSMYPASTLLLARTVLDERLQRVQVAGLVLAAVAVALVGLA